jgi:hypothetical protein
MLDINGLKIKFKKTDGKGDTLAIVTIEDETISLRGFRLMVSKYENRNGEFLRVLPPTYGSKYHMSVYFYDKKLWYQIEDKILKSYQGNNEPDISFTKEDEDWIDKKSEIS